MTAATALDETIRSIVREVVREEIRAALDAQMIVSRRRGAAPGVAEDHYLSIARAATFADVAPGTLRRWIRAGRLPVRRAGRVYRIARAELEDFLCREGRAVDIVEKARGIVRDRG